jgi:hypothetical protein
MCKGVKTIPSLPPLPPLPPVEPPTSMMQAPLPPNALMARADHHASDAIGMRGGNAHDAMEKTGHHGMMPKPI